VNLNTRILARLSRLGHPCMLFRQGGLLSLAIQRLHNFRMIFNIFMFHVLLTRRSLVATETYGNHQEHCVSAATKVSSMQQFRAMKDGFADVKFTDNTLAIGNGSASGLGASGSECLAIGNGNAASRIGSDEVDEDTKNTIAEVSAQLMLTSKDCKQSYTRPPHGIISLGP
jgi:hypothetical protein